MHTLNFVTSLSRLLYFCAQDQINTDHFHISNCKNDDDGDDDDDDDDDDGTFIVLTEDLYVRTSLQHLVIILFCHMFC